MGELRPSGAGLAGCGAQAGCCLQEQLLSSVPSICKFLNENLLYRGPNSKHHSSANDKNFCSLEAGLIPLKCLKSTQRNTGSPADKVKKASGRSSHQF